MENKKKNITDLSENVIVSKDRIFGDKLKVEELVKGLKENLELKGDGFVYLHTPDDSVEDCPEGQIALLKGVLTAIYSCQQCSSIHLVAGNRPSLGDEKSFNEEYFPHAKKIYINRIHGYEYTDEGAIFKSELLTFLKCVSQKVAVSVENIAFEGNFPLTTVTTCGDPECPSIHLECGYENHIVTLN